MGELGYMGTWLWQIWGDWRLGTRKTIGRGLSTPCKSLKGGMMYITLHKEEVGKRGCALGNEGGVGR